MWSGSLQVYFFSSTRLINSIKHEHSCNILYISNGKVHSYFKYSRSLDTLNIFSNLELFIEDLNECSCFILHLRFRRENVKILSSFMQLYNVKSIS